MDFDALTPSERRLYDKAVAQSHFRSVRVQFFRISDGNPVMSFHGSAYLGGSIQGDVDQTPMILAEFDLLDRDYKIDWTNGEHRRFKARIIDSRFVEALNDWVDCISYTGPVWDFGREGPVVRVRVDSMERQAMGSVRHVYTRGPLARATDVMIDLLKASGANNRDLSIPKLGARLPDRVLVGVKRDEKKDKDDKRKGQKKKRRVLRVGQADTYFGAVDEIAEAMNRDLWPDGPGRLCLRRAGQRPSMEFTAATLTKPVTQKRPEGNEEVINTWHILGAKPKGRDRVEVTVALPANHPESAETRNWNGTPRVKSEEIENKHLETRADARRLGERKRDQALREMVDYEVEALPILPWIRPNSLVTVPTGSGKATVRVRRWTIPLGPGPLVIGANRARRR